MKTKRHDNPKKAPARRYSAKLLFQYRVGGSQNRRRLCEERIITFPSLYGRAALGEAKRRGRAAPHSYTNVHGQRVHFEFEIGYYDRHEDALQRVAFRLGFRCYERDDDFAGCRTQ